MQVDIIISLFLASFATIIVLSLSYSAQAG